MPHFFIAEQTTVTCEQVREFCNTEGDKYGAS
jgi:hypothetical protein